MQLILTSDEKAMFDALPDALKDGWQVSDEPSSAWESDETLAIRYEMSSLKRHPEAKNILETVRKGEYEKAIMEGIPESLLPDLFFTIGAKGMTVMIHKLLQEAKTDADLGGTSALTTIRHQLLTANASHSS
jgi:hypothetical protein